jgi:hypothetical protein
VKALATVSRLDWTSSSEGLVSLAKGGKMLKGGKGKFASSDPLPFAEIDKEKSTKKKRRQKREWEDRWIVIHQGILNVSQNWSVRSYLLDGVL